jgi:hypothetical protein
MKQSPLLSPRTRHRIRQGWWMIPAMGLLLLASIFLFRNPNSADRQKPLILVRKEAFPAQQLPLSSLLPEMAGKANWQAEAQQLRQIKVLSPAQENRLQQLETADSLAKKMEDLAVRLHLRGGESSFVAAPYQRALEETRVQLQRMNLSTH